MKFLFIAIFILSLPGCITLAGIVDMFGSKQVHKLNPETYYRNDICFEYMVDEATAKEVRDRGSFNDTRWGRSFGSYAYKKGVLSFCGVGVLPHRPWYKLKVKSPGKMNFFSIITCHEEDTTENPGRGIFKRNDEFTIHYKPTLERGRACPLYVAAYSKNERHAWGVLAFEHPRYKLQATIECNGYKTKANGVSLCQSREGLIQRLTFTEEVKQIKPVKGSGDRKEECPMLPTKDDKVFLFKIPNRECIYGFIGKESRKIHQFFSIGYESIIVRD